MTDEEKMDQQAFLDHEREAAEESADESPPIRFGAMPRAIARALVVAQRAVNAVAKDGRNEFSRYDYATMDSLSEEARRALNLAGLAFVVVGARPIVVRGERRLEIVAMLLHEASGDTWDLPSYPIPVITASAKAGHPTPLDKAEAAALTYARGYLALCLLQIAREDASSVDQRDDREVEERPRKRIADCATYDELLAWATENRAAISKASPEARATARELLTKRAADVGAATDAVLALAGLT